MTQSHNDKVTKMVALQIQELIHSGALSDGQPLPSQRALSQMLGVSRTSLREALITLEMLGWVHSEPRKRTIIVNKEGRVPDDTAPLWRLDYSAKEIYHFRFIVESHAAGRAAMYCSDKQVKILRQNLQSFNKALKMQDLVSAAEHDHDFHHLIMSFSQNRMFADCYDSYGKSFLETQSRPLGQRKRFLEMTIEHKNILDSIVAHEPTNAEYFMRIHILKAAERAGISM
jgi:GntR family transcriptional repressor for pyruvate dehydrogenase complex